jgi:exodeoxyribonuclease VII small subunit
MADSKPKRKSRASSPASNGNLDPQWLQEVQQLSYRDAQTALELTLAELQSSELEVEEMAGLYRRAEAYANRCELVLESVQQEVIQWSA